MTTGDRIVLLGHDRPYLDDTDKARLAVLVAAKADRANKVRNTAARGTRAKGRASGRGGQRNPRRAPASA